MAHQGLTKLRLYMLFLCCFVLFWGLFFSLSVQRVFRAADAPKVHAPCASALHSHLGHILIISLAYL